MNKTKVIYFDMDGVLADFEKQYLNEYSDPRFNAVGRNWVSMVRNKFFERLDILETGKKLLDYCNNLNIPDVDVKVEILSSCGKSKYQDVSLQKSIWISQNGITIGTENFVKNNAEKGDFANADSLLIDDRKLCIDVFKQRGGDAVLFNADHLESHKNYILQFLTS